MCDKKMPSNSSPARIACDILLSGSRIVDWNLRLHDDNCASLKVDRVMQIRYNKERTALWIKERVSTVSAQLLQIPDSVSRHAAPNAFGQPPHD